MKKIAILTTRYSLSSPYLMEDLVEDLTEKGHHVVIFNFDIKNISKTGFLLRDKYEIYTFSCLKLCSCRKINLFFSVIWMQILFMQILCKKKLDIVILHTPLFMFFGLVKYIKIVCKSKVVAIYWDMYPVHFFEIGHFKNKFLKKILYFMENRQALIVDKHCFMTKEYLDYFCKYHPNVSIKKYEIVYAWRKLCFDMRKVACCHKLDDNKIHAVFGGQLSKGRGLFFLLQCCSLAMERIPNLMFHIIGDGPLKEELLFFVEDKSLSNVKLVNFIPREQYLSFILSCHIGIIITDENVSVPSFPSKIIDYMNVKLPVFACCSQKSKYLRIIEDEIKCGVGCYTGETDRFIDKIKYLVENAELRMKLAENGYRFLVEKMDVKKVSDKIIR